MSSSLSKIDNTIDHGFVEVYKDFERNLHELTEAIKSTEGIQQTVAELKNTGAIKSFFGGLSGKNDKQLAGMVSTLGRNLEITQGILKIVMQVQNTKNRYLKEFHRSLVNKIVSIKNDTDTLDANQKDVALAIVQELTDQVSTQIEQQEMVERHQKKLQYLDGFVSNKEILDSEQDERIQELESRALEIIKVDEHQQRLIAELKAADASKDELDKIQTQRIDLLFTEVTALDLESEHHQNNFKLLEAQYLILAEQVKEIKQSIEHSKQPIEIFKRQLPSYAALLLGIVALVLISLK